MSKNNVAVVFVASPHFEQESLFLSRSLTTYGEADESFVFIIESEYEELKDETLAELKDHHEIFVGGFPRATYPVSAKLESLCRLMEVSHSDNCIVLDTDTFVADSLSPIIEEGADFGARPEDIALTRYWASQRSASDWRRLEDDLGINPNRVVHSIADNRRMPSPFYNAGVVWCSDETFPRRWRELTLDVYDRITTSRRNADQIALGLLTDEYECAHLSEHNNFPTAFRLFIPNSVRIIHYYELPQMIKAIHPELRKKVSNVGIYDEISEYLSMRGYLLSKFGLWNQVKRRTGRLILRAMTRF